MQRDASANIGVTPSPPSSTESMATQTVEFTPNLSALAEVLHKRCASIQAELDRRQPLSVDSLFIEELRRLYLAPLENPTRRELAEELPLIASLSILIDLTAQGWKVKKTWPTIVLEFKGEDSPDAEKARLRRAHLIDRDSQVREPSVTAFIRGMEKRRLTPTGWHSIFSVMREGSDLAERLRAIRELEAEPEQLSALRSLIKPYLQFVGSEAVCQHTGLRLNDIWRYFRHTWVNSYKSVPGRSMMILVRDAACPNHPVIGIASLGSAVVQQSVRDKWIGWDSAGAIEQLRQLPPKKATAILLNRLRAFKRNVYVRDLLEDCVLEKSDLRKPTDAAITKLLKESFRAIKQHRRYPHAAKQKQTANLRSEDWRVRAETSLFRSKRCKLLATLMSIQRTLSEHRISIRNPQAVRDACDRARFRFAVGQLFRLAKAESVGIKMMDVMVCGSIAPYNSVLGGKLICFLLCSPEVVNQYAKRYGQQTSLIASSMSGKAVKRPAELVLLCTTSLYGSALSQYSRVKIPAEALGGVASEKVEFHNLGLSEGFGVFHFSRETLRLMNLLVSRSQEYRKVNSIFGEGVNPLMRKIRDALSTLGLPAEVLIKHGNKRVVYGVGLARNFRAVLLGLATKPQYVVPQAKATEKTEGLAELWRRRWLLKRLQNDRVLGEVAKHSLVYPIRHGAQVHIPADSSEFLPLSDATS
jgi:Druantia protein DruA